MRITNKSMNRSAIANIQNALNKMNKYQQMVSTGKKVDLLTTDPVAATKALSLRSGLRDITQYQANIDDGTTHLDLNESLLTQARDLVTKAKTYAQTASNDTVDAATRKAMATEVGSLQTQLLSVANTKFQNLYVFSGFSTNTKPYDTNGVYSGNTGKIFRQIGPGGVTVQVNMTGPEAFQSDIDTFAVLKDLQTALQNNDVGGINAQIDKLSTAQDQLLTSRSEIGSRINTMQMATSQLSSFKDIIKSSLSDQEDADVVEAVTGLATAQNIFQSALAAGATIKKHSLLDYI